MTHPGVLTAVGGTGIHKDSHKSGGSDALASGDLLEAQVKRLQESDGPTALTLGAVADGEFLKRDGTTIVSAAPSGGQTYVNRGDPSGYDWTLGDFTIGGGWHAFSLASIVPAEAANHLVHLWVAVMGSLPQRYVKLKLNGQVNDYNIVTCLEHVTGIEHTFEAWVMCDADREIAYTTNANQALELVVRGWMIG